MRILWDHPAGGRRLGNAAVLRYVACRTTRIATEMGSTQVATDYDEVRSDVKESQNNSLEELQSANAPDARSVVLELDQADGLDQDGPGGEFIAEELVVQVIPKQTTSSPVTRASWSGTGPRSPGKRAATSTVSNVKADRQRLSACSGQPASGMFAYSANCQRLHYDGHSPIAETAGGAV
jgi:hypothetical protein